MKLQPFYVLGTIIIFALGLFFRFSHLGNMLYSHDEAYTSLRVAGYTGGEATARIWDGEVVSRDEVRFFIQPGEDKGLFSTISALARAEPQLSPLYFVFGYYWMRIVGSSPAAMRGLAAVFGILAIPGMYWLCIELFNSRSKALLSAGLLALSPFNILYSQDARPYSLLALISLVSSAIFLIAIRENKKWVWGGYALSLTIGFYSHQLFALVALAHGCTLLFVKSTRSAERIIRFIASFILALLAFSPWLFQVVVNWNHLTRVLNWTTMQAPRSMYIQRWALIFSSPFIDLQFSSKNIIPYVLRAPVLLLIAYALYFLFVSTSRRVWAFLVLLIGFTTLPFILSDVLRGGIVSIQGRYFISANVATIPVVAHLLVEKLSIPKGRPRIVWSLIAALLLAAQLGSAVNILSADTWWTKNLSFNTPQIVQVLNRSSHPLLIVDGMASTDLGDVLALSNMVDQDVSFLLYQKSAQVKLPEGFSDIYWFRPTYTTFLESDSGKHYRAREVVPGRLWRITKRGE